jgi:hypothetical protein
MVGNPEIHTCSDRLKVLWWREEKHRTSQIRYWSSDSGSETDRLIIDEDIVHDPTLTCRNKNQVGRHMCLLGSSDAHRRSAGTSGGLTGVWAEELTVAGILEALRRRRTYATQGRRPVVTLEMADDSGTHLYLGDAGRLRGRLTARIRIIADETTDDRLELVELKHGERVLANWGSCDFEKGGTRFAADYRMPEKRPPPHLFQTELLPPCYVYLRIRHAGKDGFNIYNAAPNRGPWVWTTPVWWEWETDE